MFDQIIKKEIETATADILTHNNLVLAAQNGRLQKDGVVRYIKNCLFVVRHTPVHLIKAREAAEALGLLDVAGFMAIKFSEEIGHDAWALADLESLQASPDIVVDQDITKTNQNLMAFVDSLATHQPLYYIAYITFVEYFTVLAAPPFIASLEKAGLPRSSLTIVAHHEELDKEHVVDDLNAVGELVDTPEKQALFLQVLRKTAALINDHFNELAEGL